MPTDGTRERDSQDYSRRTLLAGERTFLAWWRTGLTALSAGVAVAEVVPRLAESGAQWAYTALGALLVALGTICIVYGEWRRIAVGRAIREGEYVEARALLTGLITGLGALVGIGLLVLIIATS